MASRGILCVVLLLVLVSVSPAPATPLGEVRITVLGGGEREPELRNVALALVPHQPGQPVTPLDLFETRQLLEESGFFSAISMSADSSSGRVSLSVDLRAALIIADVQVKGQRPFFEREILDMLSIHPGETCDSSEVALQAGILRDFYRRSGRRLTDVRLVTRVDSAAAMCDIRVELESDRYLRLGELLFRGNHVLKAGRLSWKMRVWRHRWWPGEAGRFQEQELEDDLDDLERWYRRHDHPEITIDAERTVRGETGPDPRVDLLLRLDEGPRYRLRFEGNHRLSKGKLKRALSLETRGNRADATLRRDVQALEDLYRTKGRPFARVTLDAPPAGEKDKERTVTFRIEEGPGPRIKRLEVMGNHDIEGKRLKRNILSKKGRHFDPVLAEEDGVALQNLYLNSGHRRATVTPNTRFNADSSRVELEFVIDEGPRTTLESRLLGPGGVPWAGDSLLAGGLADAMASETLWSPGAVDRQETALKAALARNGHLRALVTNHVELAADSSIARAEFHVSPGPRQIMGRLFSRGNFDTSPRTLAREMAMEQGRPFSRQAMLTGQQRLQDLPTLTSARARTLGLSSLRDTVHVLLELEERLPWYMEGAGGYHSADGLYVRARGGQRNLFGTARHLWLGGRAARTVLRAEAGLIDPRFLGYRLSASATAYHERLEPLNQGFGSNSDGLELGLDRELDKQWRSGLSLVRERRRLFGSLEGLPGYEADSLLALEAFEPRNRLGLAPSLRLDSRDSFLRPGRGLLGSLEVELSHGLDNSLEDFLRTDLEVSGYWAPRSGLVLAAALRAGRVGNLGSGRSAPADRLYFLGGSRSVRGYNENLLYDDGTGTALGGALSLSGSLEARIEVWRAVELAAFYDEGSLAEGAGGAGWHTPRAGAGAGIRLLTAIGPLGVVYAWKLDPRADEDPGRFHFNLGYPF